MQSKLKHNPNNLKALTDIRKGLRNHGTSAEAVLWLRLKERQIEGMKWRRQFGVGSYILDFYCPQLHLCIELDGAQHFTASGYVNDSQRDKWLLQEHNIQTIHIENKSIFDNIEGVVDYIRDMTQMILSNK